MAWRAAVRIAYDGRDFMGSQRQPDEPTVEGEVIRCLEEIEAISSPDEARFRAASRTDRGVSALCNVIAFDTSFQRGKLLHALNSQSDTVFFTGLAEVASNFSPRRASGRWYRYFLSARGLDVDAVAQAAKEFEGEHDFRRFCKAEGRTTVKRMESVHVLPVGDFIVIDLRAREFLRNMVRRMVAAMDSVGRGKVEIGDVRKALSGKERSFGLAPAENLVLMEIRYPFQFEAECPVTLGPRIQVAREDAFVQLAFVDALSESCSPSSPERESGRRP